MKKKTIFSALLALVMLCTMCLFTSCGATVEISQTTASIYVTETITLTATASEEEADIVWSSSDETVATVKNGKVEGVKEGTATVTATAGSAKATCQVTVKKVDVSLDQATASILIGETVKLQPTLSYEDAKVTWTSSDEAVVTAKNGSVKGIAAGTATVTASVGSSSASCEVTVKGVEVTISQTTANLERNATLTLTATASDNGAITWKSSDESVATVSASGVVTALKEGKATITANRDAAGSASCEVTVTWSNKPTDYYEVTFGEESVSVANPDTWYYWNDQNWVGSTVTVSQAEYSNGALTVSYADNNSSWANYGMQIFYTSSANEQGKTYRVTCTITSSVSGTIMVLGNVVTLEAGVPYDFSCDFEEGTTYGGSSFSIQCGIMAEDGTAINLEAATLTITMPVFTEVA